MARFTSIRYNLLFLPSPHDYDYNSPELRLQTQKSTKPTTSNDKDNDNNHKSNKNSNNNNNNKCIIARIIYSKNDVKHVFPSVVLKTTKPRFKCPTRKTMAFPDSAVPNSNCTPRNIELEIYSERVLGRSSLPMLGYCWWQPVSGIFTDP